MRYFFIEQSTPGERQLQITGSDAKHIRTVLRLKPGDTIGLFDGQGFEYRARIVTVSTQSVAVAILQRFPVTAESPVQIIVGQAFLKEKKMDHLVRQLTELGISKWIPFFAKRSVPRPSKKNLAARKKRWQKIAREALKQCKRGCVPQIGEAVTFEEVLHQSQACDIKIAFWENEPHLSKTLLPEPDRQVEKIFVLLGPEGGFTDGEIEQARTRGFITAALGPRILRAETASVAACALLQYLYGDMGTKHKLMARRGTNQ